MAKAVWVGVAPASGSGNGSVAISSTTAHTGRNARSSVVTFRAADVEDVPVTINQAGKPEFATIADSAAPAKTGQTLTISGTTNSSILTFSFGTGDIEVALPESYSANSVSTANGVAVAGDPGAMAEFLFSIALVIPVNETIEAKTKQLIVTDEAGNTDTCLITQAAGDAYLTVTPLIVDLNWEGSSVNVSVESNTSWTVV